MCENGVFGSWELGHETGKQASKQASKHLRDE